MSEPRMIRAFDFRREVIEAGQPVLVEFSAGWCRPCKQMRPIVKRLAMQYAGRMKVVEVDVEQENDLAKNLGIRKLPSLVLFKDGRAIPLRTGFAPGMMPVLGETIETFLQ